MTEFWIYAEPVRTDTDNYFWIYGEPYVVTELVTPVVEENPLICEPLVEPLLICVPIIRFFKNLLPKFTSRLNALKYKVFL